MFSSDCGFVGVPLNGGRFISRGKGRHPERTIDSDELIYVAAGRLEMFEGEQLFTLRSGEWLILRRGRDHGGVADYPADLSFFWVHFIDGEGMLDSVPQHGRAVRPERMVSYLQSYLSEQLEADPDPICLRLLLELLLRELRHAQPAGAQKGGTPLALAADKWIRLHFAEEASAGVVARALKCNPVYLGKMYHQHFGETVSQAINRLRVEYAAKLLLRENHSIKEVARLAGFNDPAYFRRQFFRRYALNPDRFRRSNTAGHINTL